MSVTHLPGAGGVRVAYAVGRPVGSAVVRNRVRRRLRAVVREIDRSGAGLATGAYLIAARPEAADRSYRELRDDLAGACAAATGRSG